MNTRIGKLLCFVLLLISAEANAQVEWQFSISDRLEYTCEFHKTDFEPTSAEAWTYLKSRPESDIQELLSYILDHACDTNSIHCIIEPSPTVTDSENHCSYTFDRSYHVYMQCDEDVSTHFVVREHFVVLRYDPDHVAEPITESMFTYDYGYYEKDLPPAKELPDLVFTFPGIHSSCDNFTELEMEVTTEKGDDDGCSMEYIRTYTIKDVCPGEVIATITEHVVLMRELKVSGRLEIQTYSNPDAPLPPPYTSIEQLKKAKINIRYSKSLSDLTVSSEEVETNLHNRRKRVYTIRPATCDDEDLVRTVPEYFRRQVEDLVPFSYFYMDASLEGINDGTLEIYRPDEDEGCVDRPDYPNEWYTIVLDNTTTGNQLVFEDPEFKDIYTIDSLETGHYVLNIYARCPSCEFPHTSVFKKEFDIKTRKMEVSVTDGLGLISDHYYMSYNAIVSVSGPNGEWIGYTEYDKLMGRFEDQWELATGLIHSPKWVQWDLYDMYNPHMGGYGQYENILWQYQMLNEQYGHGLQRMIVTKDERFKVTYRMYKKGQRDGEHGPLFKEAYKFVYKEDLWCSNDPNEIYGPAGYTNADSTIVQMINAKDDISYTIQFENDPEFATAAAARVKITCPLDEHADPTTFRLGNFGFGEYTFEVPPLANFYNNRINMDSLGYWLDVTARIQVPENEIQWIFQTIDPETGVAPIDSLGFLPVNDTLTGVGEGFVTFTVAPKGRNDSNLIHTGDSIVEEAQIYFDENDVVPTNRYKNIFDAVAPTSSIVCDTTGAKESLRLNIGFNTSDDQGGSGVSYIELYANVDLSGYEMVAQVQPDSIYPYSLAEGTNFEFMGLAVDNVGNKEEYKPYHELFYCLGEPPRDMELSNNVFQENDAVGTRIGEFITIDDQNTDNFVYTLVDGPGSDDNSLFSISGKQLKTNYDFRCYGNYEYSIRVRTTDITNASLEKVFTVYANKTETIEPTLAYTYLCPGEGFYFNGNYITEPDTYLDTLSSHLGCDSVVRMVVRMNPAPETTYYDDAICYGYDYTENGFNLTADSIAVLVQGWDMQDELTLHLDDYRENAFNCYDTARLALTIHPAYNVVDDVLLCSTDVPYTYHDLSFSSDTTFVLSYETPLGCDSTFTLNLTIDPSTIQSSNFGEGWKWYSTYIDQSNGRGLLNLQTAMGTQGRIIKSQSSFTQYYPDYNTWYGGMEEINNKSMYMILASGNLTVDIPGCVAAADTIVLFKDWNWIGYPMPDSMDINQTATAVIGYPTDNDIFKSSDGFSMYDASRGLWYGSLPVLHPGEGYMYKSNSTQDKYLYYPNHSRAEGHLLEIPEVHWVHNARRFAENITILGLIELDGESIESDSLEVGVFCNGEERGSGRAIYLEDLNAYRIFLTVHGEEGDALSFRLFDHNRDKERRIRCKQQLTFHADDHYGNLRNPYLIRFATDYDKLIEAEICEGKYYVENGFHVCLPGTYFQELTGKLGNDSIVRLDLTVHPVYHEEKEMVAVEFPFLYGDITFDRPGTYTLPFQTEFGCDSIVVLKVVPYEGSRELLVSPVPANKGQIVSLFFPFTRAEQQGLKVEVYTTSGSLIQIKNPTQFPIELDPFEVAGTYMVKVIMGTGEVVAGKIIVK